MQNVKTGRLVLAAVLGIAAAGACAANTLDDAKAMLAAGDAAAAISTIDVYLQGNPKDLDARFIRGIALTRTGRGGEAIPVFTDLAKALPNAAEPYNNLAAIYAAKGDLVKAHAALENALIRNPNSMSGRLNLGDVYLALANIEYRRALALDASSDVARNRIAAIAEFQGGASDLVAQRSDSTKDQRADRAPAPVSSPAPAAGLAPAPRLAHSPAVVASDGNATAQSKPEGEDRKPVPSAATIDQKSLVAFLQRWVRASSDGDANAFLSLYAANFQPAKGNSRARWLEETRKYLALAKGAKSIVTNVRFRPAGDNVVLEFQHEMQTGGDVTKATRSLELVSAGSAEWRVIRESQ